MTENLQNIDMPWYEQEMFTKLWNEMLPFRRKNNVGLFVLIMKRKPTDEEIEHGVEAAGDRRQDAAE